MSFEKYRLYAFYFIYPSTRGIIQRELWMFQCEYQILMEWANIGWSRRIQSWHYISTAFSLVSNLKMVDLWRKQDVWRVRFSRSSEERSPVVRRGKTRLIVRGTFCTSSSQQSLLLARGHWLTAGNVLRPRAWNRQNTSFCHPEHPAVDLSYCKPAKKIHSTHTF